MTTEKKNYALIDFARIFFALGIIGIHTDFLLQYEWGYYVHTNIFRLGVPFFFLTSGYFLSKKKAKGAIKDFIKRFLWIYLILNLFYIIISMIKVSDFTAANLLNNLWNLVTGKSLLTVWFVGALVLSAVVLMHMKTEKSLKISIVISLVLYFIGLLFNTYNFLLIGTELEFLYNFLVRNFTSNCNFIFIGYFYFAFGYYFTRSKLYKLLNNNIKTILLLIVGLVIVYFETVFVHSHLNISQNYAFFVGHLIVIPCILKLLISYNLPINTKFIRNLSTYIYYIHYAVMVLLALINQILKLEILTNNISFYFVVLIISVVISLLYMYIDNIKDKDKIFNYKLILSISLIIVFALIFIISTLFNNVVWVDEIFSLSMVKHNVLDIIKINIGNQLPLYYIMMNLFISYFDGIIDIEPIILCKIFSFIPYMILMIFNFTEIRKERGILFSVLFSFFIILMPPLINYFVEIQMYSWSLCFVTIAFFYMHDVIMKKDNNSWINFVISSILALYCDLYTGLSVLLMYIILFFDFLTTDKNALKKLGICAGITVILYLPWLIQIIKHIRVENVWHLETSLSNFISNIEYLFLPTTNNLVFNVTFDILIIFLIVYSFIKYIGSKNKSNEKKYTIYGLLMLCLIALIGVILSLMLRDTPVNKYIFPTFGPFWFSVTILIDNLVKSNKRCVLLLFIPLFIAMNNLNNFIRAERIKENNYEVFYNEILKIDEDDIIISNNLNCEYLMAYFNPDNKVYYWEGKNEENMMKLYGNIYNDANMDLIKDNVKNNKRVYFIEMANNNEPMSNILDAEEIHYIKKENIWVDRYNLTLYKIN